MPIAETDWKELNMRHFPNGDVFKIEKKFDGTLEEFSVLVLRLSDEEAEELMQIAQRDVSIAKRAGLQKIIETILTKGDHPRPPEAVLARRLQATIREGPLAHDADTTQAALPNSKKWSERLDDVYRIILDAGEGGITDEASQDEFATRKDMDRRDIGNIVRPVRNALVKIGLVYDTGRKEAVRSGKEAKVWGIVDETWEVPRQGVIILRDQIEGQVAAQERAANN
jgi:hypothetical protein